MVAIVGAITVVVSANTSDTRLTRDGLIQAISERPFIIYSVIYAFGGIVLSSLSAGPFGNDWVFVDVGLCALFGRSPGCVLLSYISSDVI
jgi:magnesium transporter